VALVIALGAITAAVVKLYVDMQAQQASDVSDIPAPKPLPVLKAPPVPQPDFEMSRRSVERQDPFQRQAETAKARVRQTVQGLVESGGAWWSPWRVIREVGGSVDRLIRGRQVPEVLEAFGATTVTVEAGLRSQRTLDYLASVGFDMRGKSAEELSARETFELLSAREIRETSQIESILENLLDKLATDRAEQAQRRARTKKAGETALLPAPIESRAKAAAVARIEVVRESPNLVFGHGLLRDGDSRGGQARWRASPRGAPVG
jgi:hypothetical protein